jgi:YidC/Oxa1 family membrane protein insertase
MEKRAIIAALLMAGLLIVYQTLFVQAPETPPQPAKKTETPAPATKGTPQPPPPARPSAPPAAQAAPVVPEGSARITGPLYRAAVTSHGGEFFAWDLVYRGEKPMIIPGRLGPRGVMVERAGQPPRVVDFSLSPDSLELGRAAMGEMTLVGEDGFGLRITQTLRFRADGYDVDRAIRVENRNRAPQTAEIILGWSAPVAWPKDIGEKFQGQHPTRVVRSVNGGNARREELAKVTDLVSEGRWIGLESEWYLSALVPRSAGFRLAEAKVNDMVQIALRATLPTLGPGETWEGRVLVYVGPKEYERLKSLGVGLEKSVYFGGFPAPQEYGGLPMEWIAVPILWLLSWFYRYTHNYGVSIVLLTVLTKVLFFPLTLKSMRSMKAMQALQPQINSLRSKHKSDPQRVQRETMELYREHRVNPLGGCLPMIVQIPVFYALYVALSVSVEMQNAPFICFGRFFGVDLWICDLAAQDPTYVLPILMGLSMLIQQKMTPTMGDPRQAKMMLIMPVVFTFMFLNLPSGLVLYWTLSNVLQIAQQLYMERGSSTQRTTGRVANKKA